MLTYQVPDTIRQTALELVETLQETENEPEANNDAEAYGYAEDAIVDWVRKLSTDRDIPEHVRIDARSLVEALDEAANDPADTDTKDFCDAEDGIHYWVRDLAGLRGF